MSTWACRGINERRSVGLLSVLFLRTTALSVTLTPVVLSHWKQIVRDKSGSGALLHFFYPLLCGVLLYPEKQTAASDASKWNAPMVREEISPTQVELITLIKASLCSAVLHPGLWARACCITDHTGMFYWSPLVIYLSILLGSVKPNQELSESARTVRQSEWPEALSLVL